MTSDSSENPLHTALRACAGPLGLVFAYSCGYNILLLATPIYLLQLYDRVLSSRSIDTLVMLTAIVAVTVVVGGVLDALRRAALGRIGAWLDERTRPSVLSASLHCAARGDNAYSLQLYRDVATVSQFLGSGACPVLFDVLWSPLFIGVLFLIDPLVGLAGAASTGLLLGMAIVGEFATEAPLTRVGAALARSHSRLGVAGANIDLLRVMGMTDGAKSRILEDARDAMRDQHKAQWRSEVVLLVTKPLRALAQVVVMGLAAWLVLRNDKSPAIIFASSLVFGRGLAPIEGAIAGWRQCSSAAAAYRRMARTVGGVDAGPRRADLAPERLEGPLVLDNVSLALPGASEPLLKSISLRLEPGECLGVIGLSGSGKSMLGRIIAGVLAPSQGYAMLGNLAVRALLERGGTRHLGYMPQEIDLIGQSVSDIIGRLGTASTDDVIDAAKLVGMHDTIMRLPNAYDSVVSDGTLILLRSHRQRLALARAVCGIPRLVVLDEPNANLDFPGEQILFDAVRKLKAFNTTVVVITHRTGILAVTDKIAILEGGALSAFGSRDDIFARYLGREPADAREQARLAPRSSPDRPASPTRPKAAVRRPRSGTSVSSKGPAS